MRTAFKLSKIAGILSVGGNSETRILELKKRIREADKIVHIISNENWPAMKSIFAALRDEAIKGLSTRNITIEQSQRFTNRMEMLRDISERIERVVKSGKESKDSLDKIMEKENG